ncbi:MAG: hypothetical protein ACR2G7_09975 [Acidimicrobiales bacterium]
MPPDLVARARGLRQRLGDYLGGNSQVRRQTRNTYDEVLVQVAHLLELDGAPAPDLVIGRRVLTTLERSLLERAVVAAGVDLGIDVQPRARARALGPGSVTDAARAQEQQSPPSRAGSGTQRQQSLAAQLADRVRVMRRRLDVYEADDRLWPTKVQEWCEDLDAYDGLLVDLAAMAGLPQDALPAGGRRRLLSEERTVLESGLARSGLDLGTSPSR